MKKKRILFFVLFIVLVLALSGCGGSSSGGSRYDSDVDISPVDEESVTKNRKKKKEKQEEEKEESKKETAEEPEKETAEKSKEETAEGATEETAKETAEESKEGTAEKSEEETAEEAKQETKEESREKTETTEEEKSTPVPAEEKASGYDAKEIAGTYYLTGFAEDGDIMATKDIELMETNDMSYTLVLNEDGTGSMSGYGQELEVKWDPEGTIDIGDDLVPFVWSEEDGIRFASSDGSFEYTFTRETAAEIVAQGRGVEATGAFAPAEEEIQVSVEFAGAEWIETTMGDEKEALVIWVDVTNISDDYVTPTCIAKAEAFQGGRELEKNYHYSFQLVPEYENSYRYFRPGITLCVPYAFTATRDGGDVEFHISLSDQGESDGDLSVTLDPGKLPGEPKNKIVIEPVKTIDWMDDVSLSGAYKESYEVGIVSAEIKEDYQKNEYLRVWFTFTNNSKEAGNFSAVVSVRAIQDGISLISGVSDNDDDVQLKFQDVEPGKSLDVCLEWKLESDSPVAIEVYDFIQEGIRIGATVTVD